MSFSIRTSAALISMLALAFGAAFLGGLIPDLAAAHAYTPPTSQIVITTQPGVGISALPNSTVTVSASGPSQSSTPTSVGTLSYTSNFSNDTRVITVIPGPYSVTAAPSGGYTASYSSGCSGQSIGGQTHTCTIIASPYTDTTARLTVAVNVQNTRGGTLIPGNINLSVSGTNPSPANFSGTISGTTLALGPGSYSVNAPSVANYTVSLSGACSGTIASGESRSCTVNYSDLNYNPYGYTGTLICTPSNQNAALGQTVTFQAYGGTGTYTWKTADRTYINIGPALTTSLQTAGPQTVVVTSGPQTATCTVNVSGIYAYSGPSYTSGGYTGTYTGGYVLGAQTGPGFPNTGFEPIDWAGLLLAAFTVVIAGLYVTRYAPKLSFTR